MYKKSIYISVIQWFAYGLVYLLCLTIIHNNYSYANKIYTFIFAFLPIIIALLCCFIFNKNKFQFKIFFSKLKCKKSIINLLCGIIPAVIFVLIGILIEKNRYLIFSDVLLGQQQNIVGFLLANLSFYIQVSLFPFSYSVIRYLFVSKT